MNIHELFMFMKAGLFDIFELDQYDTKIGLIKYI